MTLDTLLARLEGRGVTSVTADASDDVTPKPAPMLACTPVTAVTAQDSNGEIDARMADNMRTCAECTNLAARGLCLAARRGEIVASPTYEPIRDLLRRCEGFAPNADDPDRRNGRERWPAAFEVLQVRGN